MAFVFFAVFFCGQGGSGQCGIYGHDISNVLWVHLYAN